MFAEQRRRQILQILDTHGSTTLTELTRLLGASESTVRRDLQEMDNKGLLVRVFGGAMSKNSKTDLREEDVSEKQTINIAEKQRIGKYAAALIKPDDFVYIDAGTDWNWPGAAFASILSAERSAVLQKLLSEMQPARCCTPTISPNALWEPTV